LLRSNFALAMFVFSYPYVTEFWKLLLSGFA
jgi:hypothetical protein